jgi:hypothetical protein
VCMGGGGGCGGDGGGGAIDLYSTPTHAPPTITPDGANDPPTPRINNPLRKGVRAPCVYSQTAISQASTTRRSVGNWGVGGVATKGE